MQRILVATDFSVRSDRAMRRAHLLAHKTGASLTAVHVVDGDQAPRLIAAEQAAAGEVLDELTQTLREVDGITAEGRVVADDVHAGVLAVADEIAADLVVIGPHRNRLLDGFVGTTAERVVRHSERPLLVAAGEPAGQHRRALLALDFDEASKAAGRAALAMGAFEHTEVVVMHAFDAPAEQMLKQALDNPTDVARYVDGEARAAAEKLEDLVAELGLPPTCRRVVSIKGSPARTILESAQQAGCDLIVLGTSQREGFARLLVGSVTADVIRDAHRDVLIIPVEAAG